MTFPKKKSRRIVVDKHPYRWMITSYWDWQNYAGQILVQADDARNNCILKVNIKPWFASVTPGIVSQIIQKFLKKGWDPSERGPIFLVDDVDLRDFPTKMDAIREVMEG
jgi:hypothetical protein